MEKAFEADDKAPVYSRGQVEVLADPETVWGVMASIQQWPSWNPDVRDAVVHGEVSEGVEFEWKAGPGTIRSTFRAVDPPRVLGWTGKTMGIPAIHVYRLTPTASGTQVTLEESWDGILSRIFRAAFQRTLDGAVNKGLVALKAEAERRAA